MVRWGFEEIAIAEGFRADVIPSVLGIFLGLAHFLFKRGIAGPV